MMEQIQPEVGRSVNQPAEPQQTADQQQGYIPHSQHQPPTQHQIQTSQTQSKPIYRHVNAPDYHSSKRIIHVCLQTMITEFVYIFHSSGNVSSSGVPAPPPPANFQKQQQQQQHYDPATTTAPMLPERIQASLSLAEYKTR